MVIEQSLFDYTREKMKEKAEQHKEELVNFINSETTINCLAERLAVEAGKLWRYDTKACPFNQEEWKKNIKDGWLRKGSFPTLYKESCIYDKREVVACIMLITDCDLEQEENLISLLSAGNIGYDNRTLYHLHYKEGFFRLVLQWNKCKDPHISFSESITFYEKYEADVMEKLKNRWKELQENYKCLPDSGTDYRQSVYYYSLCKEIWDEAEKWSMPLKLMQQDELQRLVVLMAHLERSMSEVLSVNNRGILTRNRITRKDMERGTKFCENLLRKCCKEETWENAISVYIDEALPAIGEACWRAVSNMMKVYSECGKSVKDYSPYVTLSARSVRNKQVKQYCKVPVFYDNMPEDINYLSFSVDVDEVRRCIMEQSANTTMIANLLRPEYRKEGVIFARQSNCVQQSALSLFLRSYCLWCEGKVKMKSQGAERVPLPFYDFKRDMVIKYALACGCSSYIEMENYLEFTGNTKLNKVNACEKLVSDALEWYEKLSYEKKEYISPIEVILIMQRYYLYHLAGQYQTKYGFAMDESIIRRYVRKFQNYCLYLQEFPEFSVKNDIVGKRKSLEEYHLVWFLLMLILRCISVNVRGMKEGSSLAKELLQMIFETKEPFEIEYPNGFLMYVNEPVKAAEEYLDDISDKYQWKEYFKKRNTIEWVNICPIFTILLEHLTILSKVKCNNSSELEFLYEVWFYVMSVVKDFCIVFEEDDCVNKYRQVIGELQNAIILWTFAGGCKNFSLSYYEQYYRLNHFAKEHKKTDFSEGSRWLRYIHDLKEDQLVWNEIISDLTTLHKCREYIERYHLLRNEEVETLQISLKRHLQECREIVVKIISYLQQKSNEENLVRQFTYIYYHLDI